MVEHEGCGFHRGLLKRKRNDISSSFIHDDPVRVEISGNLLSRDGSSELRGRHVDVIPLEDGPTLILAELVPPAEWELGKASTRFPIAGRSSCPESTRQVLRVVWTGGVTKPGGGEVDDLERQSYRVFVDTGTEGPAVISPFAIGDLGDADNNHELSRGTTSIRKQRSP